MNTKRDPKLLLARMESLLRSDDIETYDQLLEAVKGLEEKIAENQSQRKAATEFEALLAKKPREEDIQAFIKQRPLMLGHTNRYHVSERVAEGVLAKFPITPDRIPDFIFLSIAPSGTQFPNRIDVFELKRADVNLFSTHNRQSKDLNDAWMEAVETQRLIGLNYADFVRRAVKELALGYNGRKASKRPVVVPDNDFRRPRLMIRILIGRRSSLSTEDMMRVRELGFSTNFSIAVTTYDSLLDDLLGREDGETSRWRW